MSRGRKPESESKRSRSYTKGKAVKYAYRIRGPRSPVKVYTSEAPPPLELIEDEHAQPP